MNTFLSYRWALAYGLYFYILFQLVFIVRFGMVNLNVSVADVALYVVGVVSVILCQYFSRKLRSRKWLMAVPFVVALPFSFSGALSGGLFGWLGIVIFGIVPFAVALPLGYWLIKRFSVVPLFVPPPAE